LTTDPIVSHPGFGQSWNPYSYVHNNPLAFTDPNGFETTDTTYSNGTRDIVFDPVPLLVRPPIGPPLPPPPNVGASQAGLPTVPVDLSATGNQAASSPESTLDGTPSGMTPRVQPRLPSSSTTFDPTFGKSTTEIAGDLVNGAVSGVGEIATDALKIDVVNIPTGLFRIAGTAWRDGDPVGGLAALFWTPGRQHVDEVVAQAIDGDFKAAAAAGVKAIAVGVAAGVALGELGAAGVEAVQAERAVRNGHLGGKSHPKSGVPFEAEGYPDFSKYRHPDVPDVRIELSGSRSIDSLRANAAAGLKETPSGYTWHHNQDQGLLQLVDRKAHAKTGHTGGFSGR